MGRWTVAKVTSRATSTAASLLDKVRAEMPVPVAALRVDAGADFMADFEAACQAKGVELFRPAAPVAQAEWCGLKRANGRWCYEFYAVYDLPGALAEVLTTDRPQHLYNHSRPHGALHGLTPAQDHLPRIRAWVPSVSNIPNPDSL